MTKKEFIQKSTGDSLSAEEWNELTGYTNDIVDELNSLEPSPTPTPTPSGDSPVVVTNDTETGGDPAAGVSIVSGIEQIGTAKVIELTKKKKGVNTTLTSGNNINIEPRESVDETKGGNISFKPGDDIEFCSHHRLASNQDEVSMKIIDGEDNPVKLQLNLESLTLTTKDSTSDTPNVLDVNVNSAKNTKGYLKVRAQAIDLRCEDHGGVALQPKGYDGDPASWKYREMSSTGVFDSEEAGTWYTITLDDVPALHDNKRYIIRFKNIHGTVAPECYLQCQDEDDNDISGYTTGVTEIQLTQDGSDYVYELTPSDIFILNNKVKKITLAADTVHFETVFTAGNEVYLEEGYYVTGMNKLKFEHGGGDGLEFGTLNTEHTSIFTDDYRFNKNGVIRIATRSKVASDKADPSDTTTSYKYVKQNDDFYDVINGKDPSCTWGDIVSMIHELKVMKANGKGPWAGL